MMDVKNVSQCHHKQSFSWYNQRLKTIQLTQMITSAQVVGAPINVMVNSPSQDYTPPDDRTSLTYDMTPGFKPFTVHHVY